MATELKIPAVGESITEVQISEWLKSEGDEVQEDQSVAIIDSEKTTFELPSPKTGRLTKILHPAGDTVKVGEVVAEMESNGERAPASPAKAKPDRNIASGATVAAAPKSEKVVKLQKAAGRESKEEKREPARIRNAGPKQPMTNEISLKNLSPEPEPARPSLNDRSETRPSTVEEEVVPKTMLRRTVARRLVEAQQTMAMLTTFNEADLSAVQTLRHQHGEAFEKRHQVKLGMMSFFIKAAIDALKQFPKLNAEIRDNDVVYRNYFDIGVAIASDRGLVVPVLRRAERLSFAELEKGIAEFARRARAGELKPDELEGGTFTITNGGVFGSLLSTPIINPPQSGILGMHTIQERPVAVNGQVVIRPMMYLALTYDHRLVDGREAVLFLRRIKESVEDPARMLVEI